MHRVRYYSRLIEPTYFSKGVRGWWIRTLNRIRFAIEACVCRQVMRYLLVDDGVSERDAVYYEQAFRRDLREEHALLDRKVEPILEPILSAATSRADVAERPQDALDMIQRMTASPNEKRYASAKTTMGHADDAFKPVVEDMPEIEVSYGYDRNRARRSFGSGRIETGPEALGREVRRPAKPPSTVH